MNEILTYFFAPLGVMLAIGIAAYVYAIHMPSRRKWHETLTDEAILDGVERQRYGVASPGYCLACGNERTNTSPDALRYRCDTCGKSQVYGLDALLPWIDVTWEADKP